MKQVREYRNPRCFRSESERGAVLVEFAIVAPLLVLLLLGIADLGLVVHEHQLVQNAAREGAHFASLPLSNPLATGGSTAQISSRVTSYCLQESITCSGITVNQAYPITVGGETVLGSQVNVSYVRNLAFPGLPFGPVTLTASSVFRNLY